MTITILIRLDDPGYDAWGYCEGKLGAFAWGDTVYDCQLDALLDRTIDVYNKSKNKSKKQD